MAMIGVEITTGVEMTTVVGTEIMTEIEMTTVVGIEITIAIIGIMREMVNTAIEEDIEAAIMMRTGSGVISNGMI